jgi:YVTN family beta-propeller protein
MTQQADGFVYVQTNDADHNEVVVFARRAGGALERRNSFLTGGKGSGERHLPSQSSVLVDGNRLFVTNAGSDDVTVFSIDGDRLEVLDRVASGGSAPRSVAVHAGHVYVLNTGGEPNITGFELERDRLERLLLGRLKKHKAELEEMLQLLSGHWTYEDHFYRYYHASWKVFGTQTTPGRAVTLLRKLLPERELNLTFEDILAEGTGQEFESNQDWDRVTRPILEAFCHAKFMIEMAVRYAGLPQPPQPMPSEMIPRATSPDVNRGSARIFTPYSSRRNHSR